jgi:hypothetical protein
MAQTFGETLKSFFSPSPRDISWKNILFRQQEISCHLLLWDVSLHETGTLLAIDMAKIAWTARYLHFQPEPA